MAESTDKLMKACKDALSQVKDGVKSCEQSYKSAEGALKSIQETAKQMAPPKWDKTQESAITENTFFKGSNDRLSIFLARLQKANKELESKVKVKNFLDVFKTQKSLDEAKKVLKECQEEFTEASKVLATHVKYHTNIDNARKVAAQAIDVKFKMNEGNMAILKIAGQKLSKGLEAVKSTPNPDVWAAQVHQNSRAFAAAVSKVPTLADRVPTWGTITKDDFTKDMTAGAETMKRVSIMEKELALALSRV